MPKWLSTIVKRINALAGCGKVRFTLKALRELASLDLDAEDATTVLSRMRAEEFVCRLVSPATGEWLYVFKPDMEGVRLYLKLALRTDCVVISFHEDEEG